MFYKRIWGLLRLRLIILIILIFLNNETVISVEVNCYEDLLKEYQNTNGDSEIVLEDNIQADCTMGKAGHDMTINGNNHILDGNDCSGIEVDNTSLTVESVQAENFHSRFGGVVKNNNGTINKLDGNYVNNMSDGEGGVLYNSAEVSEISGSYENNTASNNGGAIYNEKNINNISARFINNKTTDSTGGAICNFGNIGKVNAYFESNASNSGMGGAIANYETIDSIEGEFKNNTALNNGGAIFNSGHIKSIKASFTGNTNESDVVYAGGGAIANYGSIDRLSGKFENNKSNGYGGAIHNAYGVINIVADEQNVEFTNNSDITGSNAIYNDSGVVNLITDGADIVINDSVSGGNTDYTHDSIININPSGHSGGSVMINNDVSENIVNMYDGVLKFGMNHNESASGNFDNTVNFNFYGGAIDLQDGKILNANLGNLTLYNNLNLKIDGKLDELLTDTFTSNSFTSNGFNINIEDIRLLTATEEKKFSLSPLGENIDDETRKLLQEALVYSGGDIIESPIYKYNIYYDKDTGLINFERYEDIIPDNPEPPDNYESFNPYIFTEPVAAQLGGYFVQLESYNEAFRHMNKYMLLNSQKRLTLKYQNKYALNEGKYVYNSENEYNNVWFSPYTRFENVPVGNGPKVSNTMYGTFMGIESGITELRNGYNMVWGPYFGYNGSHQAFLGNNINQNGATAGVVAMFYKNNFFSGYTANISSTGCESDNMYGKDNFAMLMSGAASQTGYNFELFDGKFIIQPKYMMSYTYVNTFDYTNSANVRLSSSSLNAIQITPGISLYANSEKGWQPYLSVYMMWNLIDRTKFKANDVSLPQLSIKPYVMYGLGVRKLWGERFSGFYQTFITNGGRNGVGLQFGFRWRIGRKI